MESNEDAFDTGYLGNVVSQHMKYLSIGAASSKLVSEKNVQGLSGDSVSEACISCEVDCIAISFEVSVSSFFLIFIFIYCSLT